MLIWILFVIIVILLALIIESKNYSSVVKDKAFFILVLTFILFSTFRDGLGTDYIGYLNKIDYVDISYFNVWEEPIFTLIAWIVQQTNLSEVFLFLVFSSFVNYFMLSSLRRYRFFLLTLSAYLFIPSLYFNSFNVMRQFLVCSIFLYILPLVEHRRLLKASILIVISAGVHLSALFILPFLFLVKIRINRFVAVILQLSSLVIGGLIVNNLSHILIFFELYSVYFDDAAADVQQSTVGMFMLVVNIFVLLLTVYKKKMYFDGEYELVYKYSLIFVVIFNISIFLPILYRLSLYFIVFPFLAIPLLDSIFSIRVFNKVLFLLYFSFFVLMIVSGNNAVIPTKILSPITLFDKYYASYKAKYLSNL